MSQKHFENSNIPGNRLFLKTGLYRPFWTESEVHTYVEFQSIINQFIKNEFIRLGNSEFFFSKFTFFRFLNLHFPYIKLCKHTSPDARLLQAAMLCHRNVLSNRKITRICALHRLFSFHIFFHILSSLFYAE